MADNYPTHDMDGGYHYPHPSPEDLAAYEAEQWVSAERTAAGLCEVCGGPPPLVCGGVCGPCMHTYCEAMSGHQR